MKKLMIAFVAILLSNPSFSYSGNNNVLNKRVILVKLITESIERHDRLNQFPSEKKEEILENLKNTDIEALKRLYKAIEERNPDDGDE